VGKNPVAKDLRTPKYKERVVETKRRKSKKIKKKLSPKEIEDAVNYEGN
jgi:hypothetical protein